MNNKFLDNRKINLDLIRCIAFTCVVSIHFYLYTEFYTVPVSGGRMYFMTIMRSAFMIGVPLFLMLTGYLVNKKTLTAKYYKGIIKPYVIYLLCSVACLFFKQFYLGQEITIDFGIRSILNFRASNYGWYMNMYIGLFLMIPFLNLIYNGLDTKRKKQILLLTFFALSTLPSVINGFYYIFPAWWVNIYPISYYFMGAYISEYGVKLKFSSNILLLFVAVFFSGLFNIWQNLGEEFKAGAYGDRFGIQTAIIAILVFILINNMRFDKMPAIFKKGIIWISRLSLGAYLLSMIPDHVVYPYFNGFVPVITDRMNYFLVAMPLVLVISLFGSFIVLKLYDFLEFAFKRVFIAK
jgi:surface polysaccharide O-acyltransferase-like enzyme